MQSFENRYQDRVGYCGEKGPFIGLIAREWLQMEQNLRFCWIFGGK